MKLLDRLFKLEEINGRERCPTYLYRWTLARLGAYAIYLRMCEAEPLYADKMPGYPRIDPQPGMAEAPAASQK